MARTEDPSERGLRNQVRSWGRSGIPVCKKAQKQRLDLVGHGQGSRCRSQRQSSWAGACVRASGERQAKRARGDGQRRSWGHSGPGNPRLTPSCRPGSGGGVALKVGSFMNKTSAVILRDGKAEKAEEQGKMTSAASVLASSRR